MDFLFEKTYQSIPFNEGKYSPVYFVYTPEGVVQKKQPCFVLDTLRSIVLKSEGLDSYRSANIS